MAASSSSGRTGLNKHRRTLSAFSRTFSSSRMPQPVMKSRGTVLSTARSRSAKSQPFMPAMPTLDSTTSKRPFAYACRAAAPLADAVTAWPALSMSSVSVARTWGSSSTRRTRAARRAVTGGGGVTEGAGRRRLGKVRVKVVPWPGSLSTRTSPLWRRTIEYDMDSPRPEPASPLVEKNGSKMRRRTASGMPMPVSRTMMATSVSRVSVAMVRVPPSGIASIALRMRFVSSSVRAAGRPWMACEAFSESESSSGRLSWAIFSSHRGWVIATASCTIWLTSTVMNCSSGRRRANCWMRRTVSEPSMAAASTTESERSTSARSDGFCFMSCA